METTLAIRWNDGMAGNDKEGVPFMKLDDDEKVKKALVLMEKRGWRDHVVVALVFGPKQFPLDE